MAGSLECFPLTDVLALLASTGNTGALAVTSGAVTRRLFVHEGAVVAAEGARRSEPVDVVVELLGLEAGDFVFEPDEVAENPGPAVAVPSLLAEVRARLDEWQAIEAVLPSVDHGVVLATSAPADEIVLSGAEWRAVAAIAGGGPLGLMLGRLADDDLDDLDALRLLKGLIDLGLLDVVEPPADEPWYDEPPTAMSVPPAADPPVIQVPAATPVPRVTDPALQIRLDALAEQFDAVYEAQAAAIDGAEAPCPRRGLFAKLRHRSDR